MQHCVIEKGNVYNIYCRVTTQPAIISDCEISNSLGIGLNLYNTFLSIERCHLINNGSYGIYIDGSSNPVIGNTNATSNDLYYNGT